MLKAKSLTLFQLLLLIFLGSSAVAQQHIYSINDWKQLQDSAALENKKILIKGYTENCRRCFEMDQTIFKDSLIQNKLQADYITVNLNLQEGIALKIAMKHRIDFYPSYLFFDSAGQLLFKSRGEQTVNEFLETIEEAETNQLPSLENPNNYDYDFPEFYENTFKNTAIRTWPAYSTVNNFLDTLNDRSSILSWAIIYKFIERGPYLDTISALKPQLISKYGEKEIYEKLENIIYLKVKTAIKENDELLLDEALRECGIHLDHCAPDARTRFRNYFYQMRQDWNSYLEETQYYFSRNGFENKKAVADYIKVIYFQSTLTQRETTVINMLKEAIAAEGNYELMQLLAEIYYREKNYLQAGLWAEKAKYFGLKNTKDISESFILIEKLNREN